MFQVNSTWKKYVKITIEQMIFLQCSNIHVIHKIIQILSNFHILYYIQRNLETTVFILD